MSFARLRHTGLFLLAVLLGLLALGLRLGPSGPAARAEPLALVANPTATRTPTQMPTPTPTPRTLESGPLDRPLTIDGDLSDWPRGGFFVLDAQTARHASGAVSNPADISMGVQSSHDDRYLYFAFHVFDDRVVTDQPVFYYNDVVELGLDGVLTDAADRAYDGDDYQFELRADGAISEGIHGTAGLDGVSVAAKRVWDGYQIEVAIPITKLGQPVPVAAGTHIGLNFAVVDNDGTAGVNYDGRLFWESVSTQNSGPEYGRLALLGSLEWRELRLQQGVDAYQSTADTFLNEWDKTTPQDLANQAELQIRSDRRTAVKSPLIHFDLLGLPPEAIVTRAWLELYILRGPDGLPPMLAQAFQVNRPWNEGQATWYQASSGDNWALPGCDGGADRSGLPSGSVTLDRVDALACLDISGLVSSWHRGEAANRGVIIKSFDLRNMEYALASSEAGDARRHPALTVRYFIPTPTPTSTPSATSTPSPTPTATPSPTPPTGSLTARVCVDLDRDADCGPADRALPGATISLYRYGDLQLWAASNTGPEGLCRFTGLPVGEYLLRETNPPGYLSASDDEWEVEISANHEMSFSFIDYPAYAWSLTLPLIEKPSAGTGSIVKR